MGTAGLGAELEHNRPILLGSFRPDGFGRDEGLVPSHLGVEVAGGAEMSEDDDEGAGGDAEASGGTSSCVSLIFSTFNTLNWFFKLRNHYWNLASSLNNFYNKITRYL